MYSILVVVNKHNTARVASCWFIIYYRLVMHGNSNIKKKTNYHALHRCEYFNLRRWMQCKILSIL